MNPDLIKQALFVAIRYASPFIAAYMLKKYGVAESDTADGIAGLLTVINFIWSIGNKVRYEQKLNTALSDMTKGSTKSDLREVIKSGDGTSATAKL